MHKMQVLCTCPSCPLGRKKRVIDYQSTTDSYRNRTTATCPQSCSGREKKKNHGGMSQFHQCLTRRSAAFTIPARTSPLLFCQKRRRVLRICTAIGATYLGAMLSHTGCSLFLELGASFARFGPPYSCSILHLLLWPSWWRETHPGSPKWHVMLNSVLGRVGSAAVAEEGQLSPRSPFLPSLEETLSSTPCARLALVGPLNLVQKKTHGKRRRKKATSCK